MSIGIAILGAGIFARDEHVPAVHAAPLLTLKAIYSRSEQSASALATTAGEQVDAYFDSPAESSKSLDCLLSRKDIDAVIIALPILLQPDFVRKALIAGKHVLSEKPIAGDAVTAIELIDWYHCNHSDKVWSVAETFRFLPSVSFAAKALQRIGGKVTTFKLELYTFVDEDNQWFQTEWFVNSPDANFSNIHRRKVPGYQGGFLLDGGVHFVAGLRHMLDGAGEKVISVSAFTSLLEPKLLPVDTVHAIIKITNGSSGTFSVSFGTRFRSSFQIEVVTQNGAVRMEGGEVVVTSGEENEPLTEKTSFASSSGVKEEIMSFAENLKDGKGNPLASVEEAFMDLKILQSLLQSGEEGGAPKSVL